jgi:hypothetical protein
MSDYLDYWYGFLDLGKKKVRLFVRGVILKNCGEMEVRHTLINKVKEAKDTFESLKLNP